jgi:glucose-6-phosphate-specific signal transduction histidine kinase
MIINLSLADLIVMVAFSALVGLALGLALWRPSRRDRLQVETALALQEHMRQRSRQRLVEAAHASARAELEERHRLAAAFFAPFESTPDPKEHRRG